MHQRDLFADGRERDGGFQRDVVAAVHHHRLPRKAVQRFGVIEERSAFELRDALDGDALGHEGADAGRDEHRLREESLAGRRGQQQPPVGLAGEGGDLLAEMELRLERRHLREQRLRKVAPAGHRRAGNVVDRLVAIERHALAARGGQCIDDVAGDFKQAQLEGLEQPDRAGTDDQRVGFDRGWAWGSAHQLPDLVRLVFPVFGVGQRGLALGDALPAVGQGQLGIDLDEGDLVGRQVFFGVDRVDRAFGDADRAIDAFVRVDHQHVGTFAEAVDGANVHAVGVFATDAGFGDDVGHLSFNVSLIGENPRF
jgi:hypothetical protein